MPNGDASPVTILRPDDLLLLQFHFHGLKLQQPQTTHQPWLLVKNPPGQAKPLTMGKVDLLALWTDPEDDPSKEVHQGSP